MSELAQDKVAPEGGEENNYEPEQNTHLSDALKFFGEEGGDDGEPKRDEKEDTGKPKPKEDAESKTEETPNPLEAILDTGSDEPEAGEKDDVEDGDAKDPLDDLTEPKDEKAKAGWNELKTIAKEAREKAAALEAQLEEVKASRTVDPEAHKATEARIKELETQNQQFSERLKVLDLKNHPEFQMKYELPKEAKMKALEAVVPEGTDLKKILDLPPREFASEISTLAADMDDFSKTELYSLSRDYRALSTEAARALENVDSTSQNITENSQARTKQVFDAVSAEYVKTAKFKPQEIPPDAPDEVKARLQAYNESYANVSQEAQNLAFGQTDDVGVAKMAHEAALFRFTMKHGLPRLGEVVSEQMKIRDARIQELEKMVSSIKANGAKPDYGSGDTNDGEVNTAEMSHEEAAKHYKWA